MAFEARKSLNVRPRTALFFVNGDYYLDKIGKMSHEGFLRLKVVVVLISK